MTVLELANATGIPVGKLFVLCKIYNLYMVVIFYKYNLLYVVQLIILFKVFEYMNIIFTDNVLGIIEIIDNTHTYFKPTSVLNNIAVLCEIVKKCGFKSNLISNPNISKKSENHLKDAYKR